VEVGAIEMPRRRRRSWHKIEEGEVLSRSSATRFTPFTRQIRQNVLSFQRQPGGRCASLPSRSAFFHSIHAAARHGTDAADGNSGVSVSAATSTALVSAVVL